MPCVYRAADGRRTPRAQRRPRVEVWRGRHSFTWRDVHDDQRERWFLARTAAFDPGLGSLSESERVDLAEWRWWTLDELAGTTDVLVPSNLAARLRELLDHGPPDEPFDVGP